MQWHSLHTSVTEQPHQLAWSSYQQPLHIRVRPLGPEARINRHQQWYTPSAKIWGNVRCCRDKRNLTELHQWTLKWEHSPVGRYHFLPHGQGAGLGMCLGQCGWPVLEWVVRSSMLWKLPGHPTLLVPRWCLWGGSFYVKVLTYPLFSILGLSTSTDRVTQSSGENDSAVSNLAIAT